MERQRGQTAVRIPPITSVETAVRIFWECPSIGNEEMRELFGSRSPNQFSAMKKLAREYMRDKPNLCTSATRIPTPFAYEAWGLDIGELEKRLAQLRKLGFLSKQSREGNRTCG